MKKAIPILALLVALVANSARGAPSFYVTQEDRENEDTGSIQFLEDLNGDGDYLDFGENRLWAEPCDSPSMMEYAWGSIFVSNLGTGGIFVCRDLNYDDDALDYGETMLYAQPPEESGAHDIVSDPFGQLMFAAYQNSGNVYQLIDLNDDGDALDYAETILVADNLQGPTGMAVYFPILFDEDEDYDEDDFFWSILVTEQWNGQVRMLTDWNDDGDALDYGESLTFADSLFQHLNSPFGIEMGEWGEVFVSEFTGFMPLAADSGDAVGVATFEDDGRILRMLDLNGDGDCLDYGEVTVYAEGLDYPSGMEYMSGVGLFVGEYGTEPGEGKVTLLRDLNDDGDCLDYGEVMTVSDGMDFVTDIIIPEPCTLLMTGAALAALAGIAKKHC